MFEVSVMSRFSAAHRLPGYAGSCAAYHGHNWEVQVFIRGLTLDDIGMLADFRKVKEALRSVLAELDHTDLNEIAAFRKENPTSEGLARYLFRKLSDAVNTARYRVFRVSVCETPETRATYWEEPEGAER